MALPNIFSQEVSTGFKERINQLTPLTKPLWGKMSVAQMLAHCNVTYEMVYDTIHPKPNFLMRWMLKTFIKKLVVSEKAYPHNSRTAPAFIIKETRDFENEKARLIAYIEKTQQLGEKHFDHKESLSFGPLTAIEWNNMFYKHLQHHLSQFGV